MTREDVGPRLITEALNEFEQAMEMRGALSPTLRRLGRCHERAARRKLASANWMTAISHKSKELNHVANP